MMRFRILSPPSDRARIARCCSSSCDFLRDSLAWTARPCRGGGVPWAGQSRNSHDVAAGCRHSLFASRLSLSVSRSDQHVGTRETGRTVVQWQTDPGPRPPGFLRGVVLRTMSVVCWWIAPNRGSCKRQSVALPLIHPGAAWLKMPFDKLSPTLASRLPVSGCSSYFIVSETEGLPRKYS